MSTCHRRGYMKIMDVEFFLKQRTAFIRSFYDAGVAPFLETRDAIDARRYPFDKPPQSEDGEPAYLTEWIDAGTSAEILGQACVSLLSDTLKLYFHTVQREIGFAFDKGEKALLKKGFLAAYKAALGEILETDWSDCPARFDIIEDVVLVRNGSQHGTELTSLNLRHGGKTLRGARQPIFASDTEWQSWRETGGESSWFAPTVTINRDALFSAIDEVERLAEWISARMDRVQAWRSRQTVEDPEPVVFGLLSAARAALDLCQEALAMFEARRPEVIDQADTKGLVIDGRRLERNTGGPLSTRGLIGAQTFLFNLVIVENCVTKLSGLPGLPAPVKAATKVSLKAIRSVVDRQVRNTAMHIEDRVVERADKGLISSSIFEPDMLCSTRADGTVGAISVSRATLDTVTTAVNAILGHGNLED